MVFVLKSAFPWEMLPKEIGCGSEMPCRRRSKEWQEVVGIVGKAEPSFFWTASERRPD
jgi:hypothetical protein